MITLLASLTINPKLINRIHVCLNKSGLLSKKFGRQLITYKC